MLKIISVKIMNLFKPHMPKDMRIIALTAYKTILKARQYLSKNTRKQFQLGSILSMAIEWKTAIM